MLKCTEGEHHMSTLTRAEQLEKDRTELAGLTRGERRFLKERAKEGICYTIKNIRSAEERKRLEDFNNTQKGQILAKTRSMLQTISERKQKLDYEYYEKHVIKTKNEIMAFVEDLYETHSFSTTDEFEEMIKCIEQPLTILEAMCQEKRVTQFLSSQGKSEYDKLFEELIMNVDERFVAYAPKRLFRYKVLFTKLRIVDSQTLQKLVKHVKELGVLENPEMKQTVTAYYNKCMRAYEAQESNNQDSEIDETNDDSSCDDI